jgi:hypothetical protein
MTSPILGLAAKVGKTFNGIFLDATLTRDVPGSTEPPYSSYDPGPSTTVTYSAKAIVESYSAFTRGQGLVNATDMKVMILATSLSVEPQPLDRIAIAAQGFSGQIVAGDTPGQPPVGTDPGKCVWELRCQT